MTTKESLSIPARKASAGLQGLLSRFIRDERAETSIEYALIGVGITLVIMLSVPGIRDQLAVAFFGVADGIQVHLPG